MIQNPDDFDFNALNPTDLVSMISKLTMNQDVVTQNLSEDQQQLLQNFQQHLKTGVNDYQPDVFEYDDECDYGEEGEKLILDQNHNQRDIIKTIGRRKMNF